MTLLMTRFINSMTIFDYLFIDNGYDLLWLCIIVTIAGIIRGCIGFGFSALVVASTSLWLDVKFTVIMVIFMEVMASLFMLNNVKDEIDYRLLKIITIGSVIASFFGVWILANIHSDWHQILMSIYLLIVALVALFKFEFKKPVNDFRLYMTGIVAGFYNGLAGIGGIFIASMLTSSGYKVKNIRATIVVYFFMIEAAFFIAAYMNDLVSKEVVFTSMLLSIPMLVGIFFGSKLFSFLPEKTLKQMVLISLMVLSIAGLVKSLV
ncbi:MAG: putative membrane protein YfcA [Cocleimonas sp.]|jgi:uncharacterized membrane protein YfcA